MLRARLVLATAVLLAAFLAGSSARASAQGDADARARARVLFERAEERFRAEEFEAAIVLLQEALELHEAAALHHNLARARVSAGRLVEARASYVRFLELAPEHPEADEVRERITELDERIRAEEEAERARREAERREAERERQLAASQRASEEGPREASAAPWVVAAASAAPAGVALAFGARSRRQVQDAREAPDQRTAGPLVDQARRSTRVANALYGVAGGVLLTGLIWGLLDRRAAARARDERAVAVEIGPSSLVLRGRW